MVTKDEQEIRRRRLLLEKKKAETGDDEQGFRLGSLKENIVGEGAIDTPGEFLGDAIQSMGAGALRGTKGLLDLPEMLAQLGRMGVQKAVGKEVTPLQDTLLGGTFKKGVDTATSLLGDPVGMDYRSPTTFGQYSGTVGEFVAPGGIFSKFAKPAIKTATSAAIGSETAGQLTEDTKFETPARIGAALLTPTAINRGLNFFAVKSKNYPTVEALRAEKNAAYELTKQTGEVFDSKDISNLISDALNRAKATNYTPDAHDATRRAFKTIENLRKRIDKDGDVIGIGNLDELRKSIGKLYKRNDDEVSLLKIQQAIDDLIATKSETSTLMQAARVANSKYYKAKLLKDSFTKAEDQVASTGSGGNVFNKYRQTITNIKNDPRKSSFFTKDELALMDNIIQGNIGINTSRMIGKLSPTGNGLISALSILGFYNVGTQALLPAAVGTTAKVVSDRAMRRKIDELTELVAKGGIKAEKEDIRKVAMEVLTRQVAPRTAGIMPQMFNEEGQR